MNFLTQLRVCGCRRFSSYRTYHCFNSFYIEYGDLYSFYLYILMIKKMGFQFKMIGLIEIKSSSNWFGEQHTLVNQFLIRTNTNTHFSRKPPKLNLDSITPIVSTTFIHSIALFSL